MTIIYFRTQLPNLKRSLKKIHNIIIYIYMKNKNNNSVIYNEKKNINRHHDSDSLVCDFYFTVLLCWLLIWILDINSEFIVLRHFSNVSPSDV